MKRIAFKLLVCISALLVAIAANAATRPRYGGTLRVAFHEAIQNFDPSVREGSAAKLQVTPLLFDNLVVQGPNGLVSGSLARTWSFDNTYLRWQFWLRPGVTFHDGEALNADAAASALAHRIPGCEPRAVGDSVVFECDVPHPALAAQLAMPQNALVRRTADGKLQGSGPFIIVDWQPGRRAVLNAAEDYWGGRPFVDSVEITFDQNYRDQALALQLGKADVVELPPGQPGQSNLRAATSAPMQLVALVFSRTSPAVSDARIREAFSLAIDRATISNVLLQRQGEPASGLLPEWISGYAAAFSIPNDVAAARQLRSEVRQLAAIRLAYPANDALLRVIAERVALNARDIGLNVQLVADISSADVRLSASEIVSADPLAALINVADGLGVSEPAFDAYSPEAAYRAEQAMQGDHWIVPIVFTQRGFGASARVRNWSLQRNGRWRADEVWVSQEMK